MNLNGDEQFNLDDAGPLFQFRSVKVWVAALFRPSVSTFERLLKDPLAGSRRALLWFIGFSLFNGCIIILESFILRAVMSWDLIIISFFISLFSTTLLIFSIVIIEVISEFLGGQGDFSKLFYGFSTFGAPLTTVSMSLDILPFANILWLVPIGYGFILALMVCKAVHQFTWGKALISVTPIALSFIVLLGFAAIL